ncbi:MAG: tetratricopeptide repeat protein, partial [Phycisphaerae bacterium]
MSERLQIESRLIRRILLAVVLCTSAARASDLSRVTTMLERGEVDTAIRLLVGELNDNPAHEAARVLLAQAYEKANRIDEAEQTWRTLLDVSQHDENVRRARRALSRLRREEIDRIDFSTLANRADPFKIPMPETDWEGLDVIEDPGYLPPILPPPHAYDVPPFAHETQHFTVYSSNERLSEVIAERAETYLDFMTERLFGGRSWAVRFPILVYPTQHDYHRHGGPDGSAGVTFSSLSGRTEAILFYQLSEKQTGPVGRHAGRANRTGRTGKPLWEYGMQSVLPHELTHAMINEFFAGRMAPRWLQEAVAGRFEQTRDHYGEAARFAKRIVMGEYFRLRDLFAQKEYPDRIALFYEQSAAIVLYLFETGPDTMYVFLSELAAGNSHDEALSAALGIPVQNAVEEFERRWVTWMRRLHVERPSATAPSSAAAAATNLGHEVFQPWVDEVQTYEQLADWRPIDLNSLNAFAGVGDSKKDWEAEGDRLRCTASGVDSRGILGVRMNEPPPVIVACEVRWSPSMGDLGEQARWFGFAQLDSEQNDTRVEALAMLRANKDYTVIGVWSDDLAVYLKPLGGKAVCHGRF